MRSRPRHDAGVLLTPEGQEGKPVYMTRFLVALRRLHHHWKKTRHYTRTGLPDLILIP
jgi:hypothetical protein